MSSSSRAPLQRCFVLHRRDYSNTSLILELFCTETGRLPVLAKGAKRGRTPLASILQPFRPLWASWSGRGEIKTLVCAEAAGQPLELQGQALICGLYINEILMRLIGRADPHPALFAFYHAALVNLTSGEHLETGLRQFELRLLEEMGYGPRLDQAEDGPVAAQARYLCQPGQQPRRLLPGELAQVPVTGLTLLALATGGPLDDVVKKREARQLLRSLLSPHLGPKPIKSRELFRQGGILRTTQQ